LVDLVTSAPPSAHIDPVKTKTEYNGYMGEYMLSRYHSLMAEARKKLGGKCVVCGAEADLEMDHIDRTTKLFTISGGWSRDPEEFWAEVAKCQLLCRDHHAEKTAREREVGHGEGLSGKKNCPCDKCRARKAEYMRSNSAKYKANAAARKATAA
jgi:hypothetical protein